MGFPIQLCQHSSVTITKTSNKGLREAMALTQAGTPTISIHLLFYFTDSSVSFFHDAFLCRILNFSNVFDAYKRCLSHCFSRSVR